MKLSTTPPTTHQSSHRTWQHACIECFFANAARKPPTKASPAPLVSTILEKLHGDGKDGESKGVPELSRVEQLVLRAVRMQKEDSMA